MSLLSSLKKTASGLVATFKDGSQKIVFSSNDGDIGQKISFTARTINATTWTAHASELVTLPKGTWLILPTFALVAAASATAAEYMLSSNNSNDSTGNLDPDAATPAAHTAGITIGTYTFPAKSFTLEVPSSQLIYAKAISYGATRNMILDGIAIRIK